MRGRPRRKVRSLTERKRGTQHAITTLICHFDRDQLPDACVHLFHSLDAPERLVARYQFVWYEFRKHLVTASLLGPWNLGEVEPDSQLYWVLAAAHQLRRKEYRTWNVLVRTFSPDELRGGRPTDTQIGAAKDRLLQLAESLRQQDLTGPRIK